MSVSEQPVTSAVEELAGHLGATWPNLAAARLRATERRTRHYGVF